jgi:hypothetical protein
VRENSSLSCPELDFAMSVERLSITKSKEVEETEIISRD